MSTLNKDLECRTSGWDAEHAVEHGHGRSPGPPGNPNVDDEDSIEWEAAGSGSGNSCGAGTDYYGGESGYTYGQMVVDESDSEYGRGMGDGAGHIFGNDERGSKPLDRRIQRALFPYT